MRRPTYWESGGNALPTRKGKRIMTNEIPAAILADYLDIWTASGNGPDDTAKIEIVEDWVNNRLYVKRVGFLAFAFEAWETDKIGGSCEIIG